MLHVNLSELLIFSLYHQNPQDVDWTYSWGTSVHHSSNNNEIGLR
jgi:hypothetical protein